MSSPAPHALQELIKFLPTFGIGAVLMRSPPPTQAAVPLVGKEVIHKIAKTLAVSLHELHPPFSVSTVDNRKPEICQNKIWQAREILMSCVYQYVSRMEVLVGKVARLM
jgi:hypothetical protein